MANILYIFVLFPFSFALGDILQSSDYCPPHVTENVQIFDTTCLQFKFVKTDWITARNSCLASSGDLVQIRSKRMQDTIESALAGQTKELTGFWIGATDLDNEDVWKWVSGEKSMKYGNWQLNQGPGPTGSTQADADLDDCAIIRVQSNYKWYDEPCKNKYFHFSYICQYVIWWRPVFISGGEQPVTMYSGRDHRPSSDYYKSQRTSNSAIRNVWSTLPIIVAAFSLTL